MNKLLDKIVASKLGWLWLVIALLLINLAASVFHFGEISIIEAKRYLAANGIPVRLN